MCDVLKIKTNTINKDTNLPYEILIDSKSYEKIRDMKLYVMLSGIKPNVTVKINNRVISLSKLLIPVNSIKYVIVHKNNDKFDFRFDNLEVWSKTKFNNHSKVNANF